MSKKLKALMISFHFPPIASSSGFLRSLKFTKYLVKLNMQVSVLTTTTNAYEHQNQKNYELLNGIDADIHRALGFDASRQLSIKGKYFSAMTWPDKWSTWSLFAIVKALWLNLTRKFDVLWVTFPIPSALLIGLVVKKVTGLPMILDLRDPVWEEETWTATTRNKILKWLEVKMVAKADKVIFTSPGTIEKYRLRYPELIEQKAQLILNGYDEDDFINVVPRCEKNGKRVFLHSGLIPPYERDPSAFLKAIGRLKLSKKIDASQVEFRLRASGHENQYKNLVDELDIADLVTFPGPIAYQDALAEIMDADALMIFQDRTCDWQIPAKLFEYMRSKRPMLVWASDGSDTVNLLKSYDNYHLTAPLDDTDRIEEQIIAFMQRNDWNQRAGDISAFSRKTQAKQLADAMQSIVSE